MSRRRTEDAAADELLATAELAVDEAETAWFDSPSSDAAAAYLLAVEALVDTQVAIGLEELANRGREVGR
jgi:hypothetical protein